MAFENPDQQHVRRTGWTPRQFRAAELPSREEQDDLAETIRIARIIAREEIARAGGVGFAAYLAALQKSIAPPSAAALKRWGGQGNTLRGCGSRPAAGIYTREAVDFLTVEPLAPVCAAELDLEADPGCLAIDGAREALIDLFAAGEGTPADRSAREAIRDFDRVVGQAACAIRGVLPKLIGRHRKAWGPSSMTFDEAETVAQDGAIKACSVYRPGDASLSTYAQNHGWIFKALRAAEAPMVDYASALLFERTLNDHREASIESQVVAAEIEQERAVLSRTLLVAGSIATAGKDNATARGIVMLRRGEMPPGPEWTPALKLLRGMWKRSEMSAPSL